MRRVNVVRGVRGFVETGDRWRVLDQLDAAISTPSYAELATALGICVASVRYHLDRLEVDGLVRRVGEPGRARARIITPAGRRAALAWRRQAVT